MTSKRVFVAILIPFLLVLFAILFLWLRGKSGADYREGFYAHDLGTIYYDPAVGTDLSHTFVILNPFLDETIKLAEPVKTCGCIISSASVESIPPQKTAEVSMMFRTDPSSVRRSEMLLYKTGVERMPVIQLELKATTVPLLDIDVSQYVPPRLKLSERIAFPIRAVAYVNEETDSNNVDICVDGVGFSLDSVSRTVEKIGEKYKVIMKANLSCTHEPSDLLSFTQNYGVVILNAHGMQIEKDIYWTPVFPFRVTPTSVYLSCSGSKQIVLDFDQEIHIKSVIPENDSLQVHLESSHDGKNHIITLQLNVNSQIEDDAIVTNVIVYLDNDIVPHIKIPVYVLK